MNILTEKDSPRSHVWCLFSKQTQRLSWTSLCPRQLPMIHSRILTQRNTGPAVEIYSFRRKGHLHISAVQQVTDQGAASVERLHAEALSAMVRNGRCRQKGRPEFFDTSKLYCIRRRLCLEEFISKISPVLECPNKHGQRSSSSIHV